MEKKISHTHIYTNIYPLSYLYPAVFFLRSTYLDTLYIHLLTCHQSFCVLEYKLHESRDILWFVSVCPVLRTVSST